MLKRKPNHVIQSTSFTIEQTIAHFTDRDQKTHSMFHQGEKLEPIHASRVTMIRNGKNHKHTWLHTMSTGHFCDPSEDLAVATYPHSIVTDRVTAKGEGRIGLKKWWRCESCNGEKAIITTYARNPENLINTETEAIEELDLDRKAATATMQLLNAAHELDPDSTTGIYTVKETELVNNETGESIPI